MSESINIIGLESAYKIEHTILPIVAWGLLGVAIVLRLLLGKIKIHIIWRIFRDYVFTAVILLIVDMLIYTSGMSSSFFAYESSIKEPFVMVCDAEFVEIDEKTIHEKIIPKKTYVFSTIELNFYPEHINEIHVGDYDELEEGAYYRIWYEKRVDIILKIEKIDQPEIITPTQVDAYIIVNNIE